MLIGEVRLQGRLSIVFLLKHCHLLIGVLLVRSKFILGRVAFSSRRLNIRLSEGFGPVLVYARDNFFVVGCGSGRLVLLTRAFLLSLASLHGLLLHYTMLILLRFSNRVHNDLA